jgi:hypothetical protein
MNPSPACEETRFCEPKAHTVWVGTYLKVNMIKIIKLTNFIKTCTKMTPQCLERSHHPSAGF